MGGKSWRFWLGRGIGRDRLRNPANRLIRAVFFELLRFKPIISLFSGTFVLSFSVKV